MVCGAPSYRSRGAAAGGTWHEASTSAYGVTWRPWTTMGGLSHGYSRTIPRQPALIVAAHPLPAQDAGVAA